MSADLLIQAAAKIRETAPSVPVPWEKDTSELLADWIEHEAWNVDENPDDYINPRWPAFILARHILGDQS